MLGTLTYKSPLPISVDAEIKFPMEVKNLDENLIANVIDKKSKSVTIIIYIKIKEIFIPVLLSSTL